MIIHFNLFSKHKSFVLLMTLSFIFQHVNAQVIGPGDWSSLRLYGHAFNVNGFSEAEYNWIENHNWIFTVEKRHANVLYPNPSSEFASGVASDQINVNNPDSKVLFYWNASKPHNAIYVESEAILEEHPDWVYTDGSGQDRWTWDDDAFVTWWSDVGIDQMNNTSHEGVFIDLVATVESMRGDNGLTKLETALARMRDNSDGLVIHSAFWPRGDGEFLAGSRTVEHSDGVFVESFFQNECDTEADGKAMLDALLAVPSDKYIITNTKPDGIWGTDHQFGMAAHLIIANNQSFHRHYNTSYSSADLQIWHDDFSKTIGAPLGKATVDGYVYTRVFEYASVMVDILNRTSSITWIEYPEIECGETVNEPIKNLALLGTASQSSTLHNGEASRAIDGNTNGVFSSGSVTHTSSENEPWWQVDLGNNYNIGKITVFNRTVTSMERLSNFTVSVLDKEGIIVHSTTYTTYPNPSVVTDAEGVEGRFVKVQINETSSLNLAEVQVAEATVYENKYPVSIKVLDDNSNDNITSAELMIDGLVYTSNFMGKIELCLREGEYPFILNKEGYDLLDGTLDVTGDTSEILLLTSSNLASVNNSLADNVSLYPIPASDILHIKLVDSESAKVNIINNVGQIIISCNILKGLASVDIRELSSGFYVVKILNGKGTYSRKIIIK